MIEVGIGRVGNRMDIAGRVEHRDGETTVDRRRATGGETTSDEITRKRRRATGDERRLTTE